MNTGNGLGVAALVLAVLGAVVPGVGLYIGWLALVLAIFAALAGARGLAVATVAVSAVVFLLLTPSLWFEAAVHAAGYGEETGSVPLLRIISLVLLAAPIGATLIGKGAERGSG